jgi:hypothetical protein
MKKNEPVIQIINIREGFLLRLSIKNNNVGLCDDSLSMICSYLFKNENEAICASNLIFSALGIKFVQDATGAISVSERLDQG